MIGVRGFAPLARTRGGAGGTGRSATTCLLAIALAGMALSAPARVAEAEEKVELRGAGATFPAPLYQKWIEAFRRQQPDVAIAYDGVGSGEGQRRFIGGDVDFGASDAALSDEQMARVGSGSSLIPVTAGIVVVAYNLRGLGGPLRLGRDVLPDIFSGRIRAWNDPRIRASNPGLNLPKQNIAVVARLDGSGTTFAFTNHLGAISPAWRDQGPGVGTRVDWRGAAMLASGNEGVAGRIKFAEGSVGYVEYHFAKRLGLSMAHLQNKAGRYVEPKEASGIAALADNARPMPANLRLFMPDPVGDDAYPIITLTWLLLYQHYSNPQKAAALKRFVTWGLSSGQTYSSELGYIPLPDAVTAPALAALDRIN
jgi:phosphate transport system substrate-binding protein